MVSHLFFSQRALLTLVWLFFLLLYAWPRDRACRPHPAAPLAPRRQRSNAPTPCAGLTQQPPCARCAQDSPQPQALPARRPAPLPPTHRRPRTGETSPHCCPHTGCRDRGWLGLGHLRANGHPSGGPWRQCHCTAGNGDFPEQHGTLFQGKQVAMERIVRGLACLAEGLGIRATARVFEVAPHTVLHGLGEAAEQLRALAQYFLCEGHGRQVQREELYAVLRAVKDGNLSEAEALERLERSPYWVWTAMDPESKLLRGIEGGPRTLARAQRIVQQLMQRLAPDCVPLFLTDGFREYLTALLAHFGQWIPPERRRPGGPAPTPRWMPLPARRYAQVGKAYRRRRLLGVTHRVVFGTQLAIEHVVTACGWRINTAFVERLTRDIRQRVAAVGRRVHTLCQGEAGLRDQLARFQTDHNFVLPHTRLRQPLPVPEPTKGRGSAKVWRPCTPALAAGLTNHVWSLQEGVRYRVPPWPQPQMGEESVSVNARGVEQRKCAHDHVKRVEQGGENAFRELLTG